MGILRGELELVEAIEGLLPKQKEFLGDSHANLAYAGGVGSGKSVVLMVCAILAGLDDPGGISLIGRLTMPSLETSTLRTFLELMPESKGEWKESDRRFVAHNGHEWWFRHLDMADPKTVGHIKSMNISAAYVDEATEISEDIYFLILSRIRRKTARRRMVRLATNPAGHDWVWRNFFDPHRREELLQTNKGITASTFENVYLPQEYIENMRSTWPADWQDRYLYGNFSDFSDLIYKEFSEAVHRWDCSKHWDIFDGLTEPPEDWPVVVGIDIGSDVEHDPWGIVLCAVGPDGAVYQFEEIYRRGILIADISGEFWAKMAGREHFMMAFDYSNRQCGLELAEHGISGQPAEKEVKPGIQKVAQYLHSNPHRLHPFTGEQGAPYYFVSSKCQHTIRELTGYKYKKDRAGESVEEPAHENSHLPDGLRYALHTFRPEPSKLPAQALWRSPTLDMASRLYWQDAAKAENLKDAERKFFRPRGLRFQRPTRLASRTRYTGGMIV